MINFVLYLLVIVIGGSGLAYGSWLFLHRHPNRWMWLVGVLNLGVLGLLAWNWWKQRQRNARRK